MSNKPNILWIMCDQFNAECLSVAGHPIVRTPHLDRLASRGVRFSEAHCQYPQCTPSRVSMLLGQYCRTHRQYGFVGAYRPSSPDIIAQLGRHGYRTGAFGKLHIDCLNTSFNPDRCSPSASIDWDLAVPPDAHYGAYLARHGLSYPTHENHCGYGQPPPHSAPGRSDVPPEHNLERWTANETIGFMRESAAAGKPFLAFCSFERPHKPVEIPVGEEDRIDATRIPLDPPETAAQLLKLPRICIEGRIDACSDTWRTPTQFRDLLKRYLTVIEMIDDQIGRLLDVLDELGLAETTAIAFCADHGDHAGRKRIFDKCLHASSVQICRIPFLLVPPQRGGATEQQGTTVAAPVESIDLYRTFCDWAGVTVPEGVEGQSLAGVCSGGEIDAHRPVFCESYFRRSVLCDGWRLVYHTGGSTHELYDLRNDPLEYNNRYRDPSHTRITDDLKHELIRFLTGPIDAADTAIADRVIFTNPGVWEALQHQRLHRSGCESGPFLVPGRAVHMIEWKHWTLAYRVDNRQHRLFDRRSDPQRQRNLFDTPVGQWAYGELRDRLIDALITQAPARTYWEPQPLGAEMPAPEQVDAFLSQPLFRAGQA